MTKTIPFTVIFLITLVAFSCKKDNLDNKFYPDSYQLMINRFLKDKEFPLSSAFEMNYALLRQRDYYNYEVEGKTYRDVLAMANDFKVNGMPVETKMVSERNEESISTDIKPVGPTLMRLEPGSSRSVRAYQFNCTFENTSKKSFLLSSSAFQINGPFKDYILTVNYEINCVIKPGSKLEQSFLVDAREIKNNVLYQGSSKVKYIMMDELLARLEIESLANKIIFGKTKFTQCDLAGGSLIPLTHFTFYKKLLTREWKIKNSEGKFSLDFGETF